MVLDASEREASRCARHGPIRIKKEATPGWFGANAEALQLVIPIERFLGAPLGCFKESTNRLVMLGIGHPGKRGGSNKKSLGPFSGKT